MTSLDDLVRATLAERAHDVDGLVLRAPEPVPRRTRRWVAVGAVGVLAAAVLAAVVLVAPWRGPTTRDATPAGPPAGMQWVSYHGITLTVSAEWDLQPGASCGPPGADAVTVAGPPVAAPSCPAPLGSVTQSTTQVVLGPADGTTDGAPLTVAGRPARRDAVADGDRPWGGYATWPVLTRVTLPEVGVDLTVATTSEDRVTQVLAAVAYLPVDHLGCAAQSPDLPQATIGAGLDVPDAGTVAVCEYAVPGTLLPDSGGQWLVGSRLLSSDQAARLRRTVDGATATTAVDTAGVAAPGYGSLVYRFTGPADVQVITAQRGAGSAVFRADRRMAVAEGVGPGDLPSVYPAR